MPTEQPDRPRPGPAGPAAGRRPAPTGTPYRTPRYTVFLLTGAALGLAAGLALALSGGGGTAVGQGGVLGYFAAFGVIIGALVGGTLAVVAESVLNRRLRRERRRP